MGTTQILNILCKKEGVILEELMKALDSNGQRISKSETEYIAYDFGEKVYRGNSKRQEIKLSGDMVGDVDRLNYLRSVI